jgi:8-hydroxy-5-deazaflavin:NADPH oxidoreductase
VVVIGAGPVGRALARRWQDAGDEVSVAVRQPDDTRYESFRSAHRLIPLHSLPDADATVLAIPAAALRELLDGSATQLDGRLIIDATNRIGGGPMHQLELLATRLPAAVICRAFTTVGWENFASSVAGERPDLLWSGPAAGPAHDTTTQLITHVGHRPVWAGEGEHGATVLDDATRLWFGLAVGGGLGRRLALRVLGAGDR